MVRSTKRLGFVERPWSPSGSRCRGAARRAGRAEAVCGFAALLTDEAGVAGHARSLDSLLGGIAHRGGDGSGHWVDDRGMAALVHARLAIVDLSPSGAQPMT